MIWNPFQAPEPFQPAPLSDCDRILAVLQHRPTPLGDVADALALPYPVLRPLLQRLISSGQISTQFRENRDGLICLHYALLSISPPCSRVL
jgi:predicted ArsR family transcriptional regulator